ncbi:MAG TPA: SAM-dependent methyltransferase [Armatimonadota bacterium]|nr:SAM-dependent methyltransferase [Armatimonadota bacterium]HOS42516.1 SAM-dependent methyltransferase [Armatimonadota bacterium]
MNASTPTAHPASFRDPAGFIFTRDGCLYRQVNARYREQYDRLMGSGLYRALAEDGLLIPHEEVNPGLVAAAGAYRVLRPRAIPFISYPYEWCFSQWQDAALLTLRVQQRALEYGMTLKDCSAFNVQFLDGKPIFIDTLSFERAVEGAPWAAYRQFCEHFLAPLALMAHCDIRLARLFRTQVNGMPLAMAARLLPWRTRCSPGLLVHLHLHARFQRRASARALPASRGRMPLRVLQGLVCSLEAAVRGLRWTARDAGWGGYYDEMPSYAPDAFAAKRALVGELLDLAKPSAVWDIGANTGVFSRLASDRGIPTLALDFDYAAVERNYRRARDHGETHLLPLVQDVMNPSPGVGWMMAERDSLFARGPADLVMALALLHHLVVANNVPLPRVAAFFAALGRQLLIEYVPTDDAQVQQLLRLRDESYAGYTREDFEGAFAKHYAIIASRPIPGAGRILYLMRAAR